MNTLNFILLAFLAGLAFRDVWPMWVRRQPPEPPRLGAHKRKRGD